jgi:hypothetical protein
LKTGKNLTEQITGCGGDPPALTLGGGWIVAESRSLTWGILDAVPRTWYARGMIRRLASFSARDGARRRIARFGLGALLLVGGASRCAIADAGCPCGSDPEAPLTEHDLDFEGKHRLAVGCVCQCGDDRPVQGSRSGDVCGDEGASCTDAAGRARTYVCY